MLIQILISLFVVFALVNLFIKNKKNVLKKNEFIFWGIFWVAAGIAVWIPNILTKIANVFGIGRGADLIFYLSIIILFFIVSKIYIKIEKIERNITKLVRRDTLDNNDNTDK